MGEKTHFDDPAYWRDVLGGGSTADFLLQNDEVRRAIATGDPEQVHKALLKLKKASRERAELAALNTALADRRAFARETVKSPGLGRLNGFGTGMYGRTDPDRTDGTYVKTRFFSAFWLPVFPLDSWLVSDAKRGWYFLARVPLGPKLIVWRIAVLVLALLAFIGVCSGSAWSAFHTDLHVVNGLEVPVTVTVGDERLDVPPLGHVETSLSNGPIELVCTDAAGTVLETITDTLTASHAAAIYNPLGAAPAYLEVVPYSVGAAAEKRAEELSRVDWLVGISWVTPSDLDFPFEESPDEVSMPRGKSVVTRTASGVIEGGWRVALDVMFDIGAPEETAAFAARMACVHESEPGAVDDAYTAVVATRRPEAARSVVDDWIFDHGPLNGVLRFRALLDEPLPALPPDPDKMSDGERQTVLDEVRRLHGRTGHYPVFAEADDPAALSRFGGRPWLAEGEAWPRCTTCSDALALFVQLDLDTLPEGAPNFGGTGLLQVFFCVGDACDAESWDAFATAGKVVRVIDDSGKGSVSAEDLSPEDWVSKPITGWSPVPDLPDLDDLAALEFRDVDLAEAAYIDPEQGAYVYPIAGDKLGGWPMWIQGPERPECPECGAEMESMFQIDSEDNLPWMWGDSGMAHVHACRAHPRVVTLTWACY